MGRELNSPSSLTFNRSMQKEMPTFDLVTVGHFSIDYIKTRKNPYLKPTLGGPPTFVSLAAKNMGIKVSVISKVGEDFPEKYLEWLINEGIDLSMLRKARNESTTSYMLVYGDGGERQLVLIAKAPPIETAEIPESLSSKIIHVSPIAGEISYDVMERLRRHSSLLSLDPQGFLRRFDKDGRTFLGKLDNLRILRKIDVFKASEGEIKAVMGKTEIYRAIRLVHKLGVNVVIVTRGKKSTMLSFNGKIYSVPTAESKVVVDTTGAGDVFIGAFLVEYIRGEDPIWCSCVGSASASYVIEEVGPRGFKSQSEVYRRATRIYDAVSTVTDI